MRQMEGSIRLSRQEEKTIITVQGGLDQELASNLVPLVGKVNPPIFFDLKLVPYITAAGSRIILGYYQNFGIKPTLMHANQDIVDLLKLTGTIDYVNLAEEPSAPTPR